ncbi:hypothetical protein DIPPA_25005 [Diplonema papillatum]|nr:hypothetical protein DIPPA_25005 [Diplonema papillatum]
MPGGDDEDATMRADDEEEEEDEEDEGDAETERQFHSLAVQCVWDDNALHLRLLISSGLDVGAWRDEYGMTLLHWAACNGSAKCAALVYNASPDLLTLQNTWGETALQLAQRKQHGVLVSMLEKAAAGEPVEAPGAKKGGVLRIG